MKHEPINILPTKEEIRSQYYAMTLDELASALWEFHKRDSVGRGLGRVGKFRWATASAVFMERETGDGPPKNQNYYIVAL